VPSGLDRDPELGADAVRRRQQQRIAVARRPQVEQSGEAAETGLGARPAGRCGERLDRVDQGFARVDVDARILVGVAFYGNTAGLYTR